MAWLINAAQLDKFRKNQKGVVILDASYHLDKHRDAQKEFLAEHISGARFFDFALFQDQQKLLPNMLLMDVKLLQERIASFGITNEHKIIFYDNSDLHSSFRALWMFEVFGHDTNHLYILDGGLEAWKKYGGKIEAADSRFNQVKSTYKLNLQTHLIRKLNDIKENLKFPNEQVIDVRHPVRYAGGPESRVGIRSGHVPESFSFPFFTMFDKDGRLKSTDKLRKQLSDIGIDFGSPIITMCGSGITSAILNFVLALMNHHQNSLYDGSWSEWGAETLYPGEVTLTERPVKTCIED